MADKPSTLELKVNLNCTCCYKEIQKILSEIQVKVSMTRVSYDVENNTVTISGPFDPHKLSQKLHCKTGKLIKEITIVPQEVTSIRKVKSLSSSNAGKAIVPRNAIRDLSIVPRKAISIREMKPPPPCNAGKAIVPRNAIRDLSIVPIKAISIKEVKPSTPLPPETTPLRNVRPQPPLELNLNVKLRWGCSSSEGSRR